MPIYGEEKRLQMARSILPSKAAKTARRRKTQHKRRNRRKINMLLAEAARDWEAVEEEDFHAYPNREIAYAVRERRNADKLNHFERWAPLVTSGPPDQRLAQMRAMLPKGLIGFHAISHLEFYDEFRTCPHLYNWGGGSRDPITVRARQMKRAEMARFIYRFIEDNRVHRLFNDWMKACHKPVEWLVGYKPVEVTDGPPIGWSRNPRGRDPNGIYEFVGPKARWCTGLGDIEDFLDDLYAAARAPARVPVKKKILTRYFYKVGYKPETDRTYTVETVVKARPNPDRHGEWLHGLRTFILAYLKSGGDFEALRREISHKTAREYGRGNRLW
jgi:hypothetical protein